MRQTFAAAWALGLTTLVFAQAPQATITAHDARSLLRTHLVTGWPHRLLPLQTAFAPDLATTIIAADDSEWRALAGDELLEFLRSAVKDQDADITISGGQVFVKGPPAAQDKVAALVSHLSRMLLQEATVEVYVLSGGPETQTGVLTAADAERLVAAKSPPVALARTSILLGQPARVRAEKAIRFVSDYSVEVADSAAIADPVIRVIEEGLDFRTTVGQAADGRLLVRFGCSRAALAEALATRAVGSPKLGDIQLPKVRSTMVTGSGLIEDGGALVVRHDGGLGSAMLVRVRRASPPPVASGVEHQVIFADDLLARRVHIPVPGIRVPSRAVEDDQAMAREAAEYGAEFGAEEGAMTREQLDDFLKAALGEGVGAAYQTVGTRLHARGNDEKIGRIRETIADLAKRISKNVVVDLRMGKIDLAGRPLPGNADDLVAKLSTSASVVTRMSDQFLIAAGLEQTAIIDHDVEIAQKSQIADPIVAVLFDGYVVSGVASAPAPDRIELALDLQLQEVLPLSSTAFPLRAENVGPVDLPQIEAAGGRYRLLLEPGKWTIVTMSNPSEGSTLVILARARWQ